METNRAKIYMTNMLSLNPFRPGCIGTFIALRSVVHHSCQDLSAGHFHILMVMFRWLQYSISWWSIVTIHKQATGKSHSHICNHLLLIIRQKSVASKLIGAKNDRVVSLFMSNTSTYSASWLPWLRASVLRNGWVAYTSRLSQIPKVEISTQHPNNNMQRAGRSGCLTEWTVRGFVYSPMS